MKNKTTTIIILIITFILAGVAIFTAIRLYQLRTQPVAPNVPSSKPKAAGQIAQVSESCGGRTGIQCAQGSSCIYAGGVTRPSSVDEMGTCVLTQSACNLTFSLTATSTATATATATSTTTSTATSTATATATGTSTATSTATATPNNCGGTCGSNSNCQGGLVCVIATGQTSGYCRNQSCTAETDCSCSGTPGPTQPSLPNSGTSWPSVFGMGLGILVIIGSLLLAL